MASECPKCHQGTTPKSLADKGMCASCYRIWGRATIQETLDSIPPEVEPMVKNDILTKSTLALAASGMKKLWPLKFPLREWDMVMVVLVDERGRERIRASA